MAIGHSLEPEFWPIQKLGCGLQQRSKLSEQGRRPSHQAINKGDRLIEPEGVSP